MFNNATQNEHQQTVDFLRESLSSPNNSQVDNTVLDLLLSDYNVRAAVLGPLLEEVAGSLAQDQDQGDGLASQDHDELEIVSEDTEVESSDADQKNLRKLSGKFSRISDLLNKAKQGRKRSNHGITVSSYICCINII